MKSALASSEEVVMGILDSSSFLPQPEIKIKLKSKNEMKKDFSKKSFFIFPPLKLIN
jgi:hypothetical protein